MQNKREEKNQSQLINIKKKKDFARVTFSVIFGSVVFHLQALQMQPPHTLRSEAKQQKANRIARRGDRLSLPGNSL